MTDRDVLEAKSDALRWQAMTRSHAGERPSEDQLVRERLAVLAQTCPGAGMAGAVLSVTGWHPVPLNPDTREASAGPLTTAGGVFRHYRNRHADGCGLQLGGQLGGVALAAVSGTAAAYAGWIADRGVDRVDRVYDGRTVQDVTLKDTGRHVTVSWQPPWSSTRSSGAVFGQAALDAAAERMRPRCVGADEKGWILWAAAPSEDGRFLTFPARKKLSAGLEVLGVGVVPLVARRVDGWTVAVSGLPMAEPMPAWLVGAFGGRS